MRKLPAQLICLAVCFFCALPCRAGETKAEAGIGWAGEFNDNVRETAHGKKADFITHIKPNLKFDHEGGRVQLKASYKGDYQYYTRGNAQDDYAHYLNAFARGEIVENLFFIEVSDDLKPVYSNAARGDVIEGDTTAELVNRNQFRVSPYFTLQFTDRTQGRIGYSFTDTRYSNDSARRHEPMPNFNDYSSKVSQENRVFAQLDHELSERVSLMVGLEGMRLDVKQEENKPNESLNRYLAYAGGKFALSEDVTLNLRLGGNYTAPDASNASLNPYVLSSLTWTVGRSLFGLSYDIDYTDDPQSGGNLQRTIYRAWWNKTFDRSTLNISAGYSSYERLNSSATEYFRPSLSYTYDLSERLRFFTSVTAEFAMTGTEGDRYYTNTGFKYDLTEQSWASLSYISKSVGKSSTIGAYDVNRVMLELYVGF